MSFLAKTMCLGSITQSKVSNKDVVIFEDSKDDQFRMLYMISGMLTVVY